MAPTTLGRRVARLRAMTQSQKVEQAWETPSLEEIPKITKMHVQALESMQGDEVWVQAGMHHVTVQTVGRKSGKVHKVALPIWRDANGHRIVVASFAGAKGHPSWYLNLRDREANPEVLFPEDLLWEPEPAAENGRERQGDVILIPRREEGQG